METFKDSVNKFVKKLFKILGILLLVLVILCALAIVGVNYNHRKNAVGDATERILNETALYGLDISADVDVILGSEEKSEEFVKILTEEIVSRYYSSEVIEFISLERIFENLMMSQKAMSEYDKFYISEDDCKGYRKLVTDIIVSSTGKIKNEALSARDITSAMDYLKLVSLLVDSGAAIDADMAEIASLDAFSPILLEGSKTVIIKDNAGGYYDTRKDEYKYSSTDIDPLGTGAVARSSTIYGFLGDFMYKEVMTRYIRKNGSSAEEKLLSSYDDSETYYYYCGESSYFNVSYLTLAEKYPAAYGNGSYFFAFDDHSLVCFSGLGFKFDLAEVNSQE